MASAPSLLSIEHSGPGPGAAVEDFSSCENGVAAWARSRTRRDLQTASRLGKSGSAARASRGWSFPAASGSSARRRSAAVRGCARSSSSRALVWSGSGNPASRGAGSRRSSFRGASASSGLRLPGQSGAQRAPLRGREPDTEPGTRSLLQHEAQAQRRAVSARAEDERERVQVVS